ncbi:MAG: pyruvate, phosphate dikinase [Planctomycetota bacterium]
MDKLVYFFGGKRAEGEEKMREILGGKGAGLAEMVNLGIPVPPGFTISTTCCKYYVERRGEWPAGLAEQVDKALERVEQTVGKKFGSETDPLLVSVRSGAAASMPGMMDTVLNLGLNPRTLQGLIRAAGNERFAWDAFRRLIHMFGDVVMGVPRDHFEAELSALKKARGVKLDTELNTADLRTLCDKYLAVFRQECRRDFPEDPREQLRLAINAVFESWNTPRAVKFRELSDIRGLLGTAVNVQAMVFGNMGDDSATGVCFTRDPSTGQNVFWGEFLPNAQGEDVVAGIRTPMPISEIDRYIPGTMKQLLDVKKILESHYRDMQDIEFTVERKHFYMLQTRRGKRTATAAVKIAVDMLAEGMIDKKQAVLRVEPAQIDQLLHPTFDPKKRPKPVAKGLPASPGAATGRVYFNADEAEAAAKSGAPVILVRNETSPEDIGGMAVSKGILTARGGMTSHAAVVARGMGKCCVAGCGEIDIEESKKRFTVGGHAVKEGDFVSLDGSTGELMLGKVDTVDPEFGDDFRKLMSWADEFRRLRVRTNADTPHDSKVARDFGAEGIGLTRTEHMFFEPDRIVAVREMILAANEKERRAALEKILPYQRGDFEGIFTAMSGLPVTIRLLDPPLHEFLPFDLPSQQEMAEVMKISLEDVQHKVSQLHELNPMLGHRGCRLGITHPEIYEIQVRAIIEAAAACEKRGVKAIPEIMIPLVATRTELSRLREMVERVAGETAKKYSFTGKYLIGTMIEVPRACVTADEIAEVADFFSFGTNDLTQMTYGFSRDDTGPILTHYTTSGILEKDPFQTIDRAGVGALVKMAVEKGRAKKPGLKLGICGEHGGEPASVAFCHQVGLDYVSCSPYRVPVARLAAAQAALKDAKR